MKNLVCHDGRVVPLARSFVDTDQIIPAEFTKTTERHGYSDALFAHWREDPRFVLNDERYEGATILLAGRGFGVGSSREHAVWAMLDYGFSAVLSEEFGDIFKNNCDRAGLLAVELEPKAISKLWDLAGSDSVLSLRVDVENQVISGPGTVLPFAMDPYTRSKFLTGRDDIATALDHDDEIAAYERARAVWMPSA